MIQIPEPVIVTGERKTYELVEIVTVRLASDDPDVPPFLLVPREISRRTIRFEGQEVTETRYALPTGEGEPAPQATMPQYLTTEQTVALWDWSTISVITPSQDGQLGTAPVSANDTIREVWGANTTIIRDDPALAALVELYANHDLVQRLEGTAARLFMDRWGSLREHEGETMAMEYAMYLANEMTVQPDGSLGLGAQAKHRDGVIWAINAENEPHTVTPRGLSPWIWRGSFGGVLKPLKQFVYPWREWVPVKIESLLHETAGECVITIGGDKLFEFGGRTLPDGIGLSVYNIRAVAGYARALFSNVRWEIR